MKLTFLGAAQTVTGSKYLLEIGQSKILIDCGLFQGYKDLRLRNREPFPVNPKEIDHLILTHAHIDHSGYIPLLVRNGFRGKIYVTGATKDLCEILLEDSGYLQEEDARRANKYGYSKHKPAEPLYTMEDAKESLKYFHEVDFDETIEIEDRISFCFQDAGHILGAATVLLQVNDTKVLFSGDLGRPHDAIMKAPKPVPYADYLILESTYGNRLHEKLDVMKEIEEIINHTFARGGSVIIPSFAVGRAQTLLYYIYQLKKEHRIPDMPVYLDSPMAQDATDIMCRNAKEHRLSKEEARQVCSVATYTRSPKESKHLHSIHVPIIIVSASGMATGGRILHHLKHYMVKPENTILFAGFQAGGTRGDRIVKGEREIKIHGRMYRVRARVESLNSLSAHADYEEIFSWLSHFKEAPKQVFLTHGESSAISSFQDKIQERLGWNVTAPEHLETVEFK